MPHQRFAIESFAANDLKVCRPLDDTNPIVSKCIGRNLCNRSLRHIKVTQASQILHCLPVLSVKRSLETHALHLGQSTYSCHHLLA